MNRKLIVEAIKRSAVLNRQQLESLVQALSYLSDTNLLSLAIDLGIDTDAILSQGVK